MSCARRPSARATEAKAGEAIRERRAAARLDLVPIDTSNVDSARTSAATILDRADRLDLLVNNAGVE